MTVRVVVHVDQGSVGRVNPNRLDPGLKKKPDLSNRDRLGVGKEKSEWAQAASTGLSLRLPPWGRSNRSITRSLPPWGEAQAIFLHASVKIPFWLALALAVEIESSPAMCMRLPNRSVSATAG